MQRIILLFTSFIFFHLNIAAQIAPENIGKQSALTLQYLSATKSQAAAPTNSKFVYSQIDNQKYINAFIKVNNALVESELNELGILIGTKAGNIWTIKIPVEKVEELTLLEEGIDFIQLDQPIYSNMAEARAKTNVDLVHEGIALPQAYTGKDVVVGILDVGFDYTHPTFYDETGTQYRIKKIWEQKSIGTPPATYSYGHEIIDSMDMIARQTDNSTNSHGAHVAGIAAGSGFGGDNTEYRGVAYESDLVLVGITPAQNQWTNTGMTDIVDGLNYIFEYAESEGKPAVANLSWGCSIGPHDGTSLFSQAVDNLTGAGKIFTVSAGNNGGNKIHLNKEFSDSDTLVQTFIDFSANLPEKKSWLDIWGESGESFCIQFETYSVINPVAATGFLCLENSTIDTFLIGSDDDTCFINLTTVTADINGKPHAFLDIHSKTGNFINIAVKANSGSVDMWLGYVLGTRGYYGSFFKLGPIGVGGDDDMTIGEMGCTESAITVGAYASKTNFTNLSGQPFSYDNYVLPDRICPFSSKGPTSDGRFKPDITAPGMTLASAVNSFDMSYVPGGASYGNVVHQYTDLNSHDYYFGESSGTSMSAPMTAGIVALVLEADPFATPDKIKWLMASTAIKDTYTTDDPDANIWGVGKIDAYAIMESVFISAVEENVKEERFIYPNPTRDILNINLEGEKLIIVSNMIGETCQRLKTSETSISLSNLNAGIYLVAVYSLNNKLLTKEKIVKI